MPTYKISQLTTATAVSATNQFEINQNGTSKSVEVSVIDAYIKSTSNLPVVVSVSSASDALRITQTGTGNALVVEDSANPDATPFVVDASGNVGIGTTSPDSSLTVNTIASFGAGTAALPSIAAKGNLNTGIWFPTADTIAFSTAGTEDFRIGSAGQLGVQGANYGTSGQVLTSGGAAAAPSWATVSSAKATTTNTFNSSGTWTKPSGYGTSARAFIQVWGGGGAGGRYSGVNPSGSGGGGGGYSERWIALSDLSATETVTIGAGGTAGTGSGGAGGNTTFGSILTGYGGGGGAAASGSSGGSGGGQLSSGGNGVAGGLSRPGQPWIVFSVGLCGSQDTPMSQGGGYAGLGGHGFWGGGGGAGGGNNPGFAGGKSYYGGGGGGGGAASGAAGAGGVAVIGGNGGTGGVGAGAATAGVQPGGGGGGSYTGSSGAGAAGRVIITVFDGV